jgi:peptide/nickel transport system permease protein
LYVRSSAVIGRATVGIQARLWDSVHHDDARYAAPVHRAGRRFVANRGAVVGALLVLALIGIALLAPVLASKDPLVSDVEHGLSELGAPLPPSADAVLGTDQLGRDVWARVVSATRTSLAVAAVATLITLAIGVSIGLIAG